MFAAPIIFSKNRLTYSFFTIQAHYKSTQAVGSGLKLCTMRYNITTVSVKAFNNTSR